MWKIITILIIGGAVFLGAKYWIKERPVKNIDWEKSTEVLPSGIYAVIPEESMVTAEGRKILIPGYVDEGSVMIKSGSITILNGDISEGSVVFDMSSISVIKTGIKKGESMLAKHLKSADFFDAEKYPTALFSIKEAQKTDGNYMISGDLTVKGITKSISFPVKISAENGILKILGEVELDRTEWDIRYGSGKFFQDLGDAIIGDTFFIRFTVLARKAS